MNLIRLQHKDQRSDEELISLFTKKGDATALGQLFDRYIELVYGVALKYLKQEDDSKDAVIQIYEKLNKKLASHKVENFKSWLHVMTKNHCLEILRKKSRSKEQNIDPQLMQSVDLAHHDNDFELEMPNLNGSLSDCIKKLNDEQRSCIEYFYFKEKSYKDIASLTGIDQNKVRSFIQNGRRNLKLCMEKKHGKERAHRHE